MRIVSARWLAERAAERNRLRDQIADLQQEVREVSGANGRIARAAEDKQAVIGEAERRLSAENRRLRNPVDQQRTTIRGLNSQLDHALGYTSEEIALLDAGAVKKELTAR